MMLRSFRLAAVVLLAWGAGASAQEWAAKMFADTNHDFGVVARGAEAEFRFELQNIYEEDVHIASVRSSCGCTTPSVPDPSLATWEKGAVVATFNTRSFLGHKSATITVTFDKPYFAEVQLKVSGFIRGDVVFTPGNVNFGETPQTETAEQMVRIDYAGRGDWQIVDVRSANSHLEVELEETARSSEKVTYNMLVRLKDTAPPGFLRDQLAIITNDEQKRSLMLPVQGSVVSPLTVSPASLFMGVLAPGESVTKKLLVRGKEPFQIAQVQVEGEAFEIEKDEGAKALHILPVTFTAPAEAGEVAQKITIVTESGAAAQCVATATVK